MQWDLGESYLHKQVIKSGKRDTIRAGANYSAPGGDFPISHLPPKQDVPLYGSTFTCKRNTLLEYCFSPAKQSCAAPVLPLERGGPFPPLTLNQSWDQYCSKWMWKRVKEQNVNQIIFVFGSRIWPLLLPTGTANLWANCDCQVCVSANLCFVSGTRRQ